MKFNKSQHLNDGLNERVVLNLNVTNLSSTYYFYLNTIISVIICNNFLILLWKRIFKNLGDFMNGRDLEKVDNHHSNITIRFVILSTRISNSSHSKNGSVKQFHLLNIKNKLFIFLRIRVLLICVFLLYEKLVYIHCCIFSVGYTWVYILI